MKDRVFIAWSGTIEIALKVKRVLEDRCNYRCFIGGNESNDSNYASVGDTVLQQIKSCNQAIVIFQKRDDGNISNNLFFELGYALASYGQTKVHCVRPKSDKLLLPSDFDNSFVEPIDDSNTDTLVNGIVDYFLARQKLSVNINKMQLINNRYRIKEYIKRHFSEQGSKCSDYELAQYLLFYVQAAQMFDDINPVRNELETFKHAFQYNFSKELSTSVDICLTFFELYSGIEIDEASNSAYIDRHTYRRVKEKFTSIEADIEADIQDDDTGIFDEWAKVFTCDYMVFATDLYLGCPELSEERKIKIAKRTIELADECIARIEKLQAVAPIIENNDHVGILSLFKSYIYEHKFIAYDSLGDASAVEWLKSTKKEKASLRKYFDYGAIDSQLSDNLDMEYCLTLIKYLSYSDKLGLEDEEIEECMDEIGDFLTKTQNKKSNNKFIEKIANEYEKYSKII